MGLLADPAVLGSVVMAAVLSGWLLGRRHGVPAPDEALAHPTAEPEAPSTAVAAFDSEALSGATSGATACQHVARAERRQVIEAARSLGELHAEITAYRRQEQVLASALSDGLLVELLPAAARGECRYLGLIGQPTCPLPGTGHAACARREGCTLAQPVAEPSALTRV
jgi:hypothetical protein